MADEVTLLDLSFNVQGAADGLDQLIAKSVELAEKKAQLTKQINAEKYALAGIRQNYKDGLLDQQKYEKAVAQSTATIVGLQKDLNNTNNVIKDNNAAIKANTTIVNSQAETVETLRAKLALNTAALNKMSVAERTTGAEGKALVEQTKALSDQLKDLEKGVGDNRRNVGNYAGDIEKAAGEMGGLTGATGMMVKGMSSGITSVKAFNAALMANPFVAIASAVLLLISHLAKLKDRNEELAVGIKTLFAPVQFLITKITDAVAALLAAIVKGINWLYDVQVNLLDALGVLPDGFKKAREEIKGVAQAQRDLYNAETDSLIVLARQRRELEAQKSIISDQSKTSKERQAAAQKALEISKQMEETELALAEAKYKQVKLENGLSYTKDEERRKEVEHQAEIEQKQADYLAQRKEIISQLSGLQVADTNAQIAAAKAAATAKANAEKAAAEKAKKTKEDAEKKAAETAKKIQQEVLTSYENGITELQLKIRERNIGIVDKQKAIEDQNEINQAILEKERFRLEQGLITQAQFDNTRYEMQVALQEKVYALEQEKEQQQKEREAMNLDNRRILQEQSMTDEFDLRQMQLDQQYQQELANAERIGADTTLVKQKYEDQKKKIEAARLNATLQMNADTAGNIASILGEESAAGKAFAIAQATINTYLAATKAMTSLPFPANVAAAAATIVSGLKQVASIVKVKDDVPAVKTSVKKFAKGGTVFGAPHSQGGVTFTGSNGQQFEAEGGENMYILNKRASRAINALSALNQQYGGRSFSGSNAYKYAQGGGFDVISTQSYTNISRAAQQDVNLSAKTIAAIALAFVEGVESAPNPIVSVQDIDTVQQNRVQIIDSALI